MATIEEYFENNEGAFPEVGVVGVESDWMGLCALAVPHGKLWAGDPWTADEETGCTVDVPAGTYRVEVKGMDFDGHRRLARLRLCLEAVAAPALAEPCGVTITDIGQIGACDMAAMDEAVTEEHSDEYMEDIESVGDGMGAIAFEYGGKSFEMVIVPSGLGDGEFAVYPLEAKGKTIGMEVEFLPPDFAMDEDIPILGEEDEDEDEE